nr:MAG TPA: hypothetical protein [Caudoviricetes sp.]
MNRFMLGCGGGSLYSAGSNEVLYSNFNPPDAQTINVCEWDDSLINLKLKVEYYTISKEDGSQGNYQICQLDSNGSFNYQPYAGNRMALFRAGNYLQWDGYWNTYYEDPDGNYISDGGNYFITRVIIV